MVQPIQSRTRLQIRQSIGRNLGMVIVGTATGGGDNASLLDTYGMARGGNDEYNGRQVQFNSGTNIAAGDKTFVTDYAVGSFDATLAPVVSGSVASGDTYEMWESPWLVEDINDAIDQAIMEVTDDCLQIKETHNTYTAENVYEYDWLSGFVGLSKVEWVYTTEDYKELHDCDIAWDELVDGDVTASVDTALEKEGTGCLKLVVAAGCGAGDILATEDISLTDISELNEAEIWIRSSVALDAGDIQLLLDNTAQCASPVETLDIPATTANTWTRHVISLANPENDSAIISVGLKMVVDKGSFNLFADDIRVVLSGSRCYKTVPPEHWAITRGATAYLTFTQAGLSLVGSPTQIRLTGMQKPSLLTADTSASEVDPDWIISRVTGKLLLGHAKSRSIDINDRQSVAKFWLGDAERKKTGIRTGIPPNLRVI